MQAGAGGRASCSRGDAAGTAGAGQGVQEGDGAGPCGGGEGWRQRCGTALGTSVHLRLCASGLACRVPSMLAFIPGVTSALSPFPMVVSPW